MVFVHLDPFVVVEEVVKAGLLLVHSLSARVV